MRKTLEEHYGVSKAVLDLGDQAEARCQEVFQTLEDQSSYWELRLLQAFQEEKFSTPCLGPTTGYGTDDLGREALERILARALGAEKTLLRMQFSSGTHVLATCLRGLLRPGNELLVASGEVYDTLHATIGENSYAKAVAAMEAAAAGKAIPAPSADPALTGSSASDTNAPLASASPSQSPHRTAFTRSGDVCSLEDQGVSCRLIPLKDNRHLDLEATLAAVNEHTGLFYIQKSRGYSTRPTLTNEEIHDFCEALRKAHPDIPIMVDNCYGEFINPHYPMMGADIIAGSLIKNAGGGIARTGAYVAGKATLVDLVSMAFTASNVGGEIGPSLGCNREIGLGLFLAPRTVLQAVKTAVFTASLFDLADYGTSPAFNDPRNDIVEAVQLGTEEKLIAFVQAIQKAAPVDSMYAPIPAPQAGYDCQIIMASGSFTSGSSIELSADGPMREPYQVFMQGALTYTCGKLGALLALDAVQGL